MIKLKNSLIALFIILIGNSFAQDKLIKTNLMVLTGKIVSENENHILFAHAINGDTIKQIIENKDIVQLIYSDGSVKHFKNPIIAKSNLVESSAFREVSRNLIKTHNYTFILYDNQEINATLIKYNSLNYVVSEKNGEFINIPKLNVKSVFYFSDTLNQNIIIPFDGAYVYNHRIYTNFEINEILINSKYSDVSEIAKQANRKIETSKFLLVSGIVPCSFAALGIVASFFINMNVTEIDYRPLLVVGSGIICTLPFVIFGKKVLNKGVNLNKKAIILFNSKN